MSEVLLINPRKRKRKKTKRKKTTTRTRSAIMRNVAPRKRRTRKTVQTLRAKTASRIRRRATAKKSGGTTMAKRKRRSYRRNPSKTRQVTRRAARRARTAFGGLNFATALKNLPWFQAGMFASKWLAKRFGGKALETDPASWGAREYIQGALGAVAAGFLANMMKPGIGQKVLEGGLNLMTYEMIQNELIAGSEWASGQFGAEQYSYEPGDVEQDEQGRSYLLGEDYQWRALPEETSAGQLEPVGPLGMGALEPVGPLGETNDDIYRKALLES